jgi:hypothetical protein
LVRFGKYSPKDFVGKIGQTNLDIGGGTWKRSDVRLGSLIDLRMGGINPFSSATNMLISHTRGSVIVRGGPSSFQSDPKVTVTLSNVGNCCNVTKRSTICIEKCSFARKVSAVTCGKVFESESGKIRGLLNDEIPSSPRFFECIKKAS